MVPTSVRCMKGEDFGGSLTSYSVMGQARLSAIEGNRDATRLRPSRRESGPRSVFRSTLMSRWVSLGNTPIAAPPDSGRPIQVPGHVDVQPRYAQFGRKANQITFCSLESKSDSLSPQAVHAGAVTQPRIRPCRGSMDADMTRADKDHGGADGRFASRRRIRALSRVATRQLKRLVWAPPPPHTQTPNPPRETPRPPGITDVPVITPMVPSPCERFVELLDVSACVRLFLNDRAGTGRRRVTTLRF